MMFASFQCVEDDAASAALENKPMQVVSANVFWKITVSFVRLWNWCAYSAVERTGQRYIHIIFRQMRLIWFRRHRRSIRFFILTMVRRYLALRSLFFFWVNYFSHHALFIESILSVLLTYSVLPLLYARLDALMIRAPFKMIGFRDHRYKFTSHRYWTRSVGTDKSSLVLRAFSVHGYRSTVHDFLTQTLLVFASFHFTDAISRSTAYFATTRPELSHRYYSSWLRFN
jgi:hypothetical protein